MDAFRRPETTRGEPPRGSPPEAPPALLLGQDPEPPGATAAARPNRAPAGPLGPPRDGGGDRPRATVGRRRGEPPFVWGTRAWARALAGPPDAVARCVALIAPGVGPADLARVFENARGVTCVSPASERPSPGGRCATARFRTGQARLGPVCSARAAADESGTVRVATARLAPSDACPGRLTALCAVVGLPPPTPARRTLRRLTLVDESDEGDDGGRACGRREDAGAPDDGPPGAPPCARDGGHGPSPRHAAAPPTGRPEWGRAAPAGDAARGRGDPDHRPGPGERPPAVDPRCALEAVRDGPPADAARTATRRGVPPVPRPGAPPGRRPTTSSAVGPPVSRPTNTARAATASHRVDEWSTTGSTSTAPAMEARAARTGR